MKKIAFVNYHPVDSQIVRYVSKELIKRDHIIKFYFSDKENIIKDIIESDGFDYEKLGCIKTGILKKIISSLLFLFRLIVKLNKFKPSLIFSPSSIYTGISAKILKIPLICWADTETASINLKTSLPFISSLLVSNTFLLEINNKKKIEYSGYKEIAYCHPNWFTPDSSVLKELRIKPNEKIILIRFSALEAMHDIGLKSVVNDKFALLKYIGQLEKYARVFISMTEKELGEEFEKYKLNIHPAKYIHLLAYSSLYIGEGTTTASEAGVLGVPWINIQKTTRGYLIDQEKNYGLGIRTDNIEFAFRKGKEYLTNPDLKEEWKIKQRNLFEDKIDVTAFLIWFIENYPQSHKIMKKNPDYQNKFK